MGDCEGFSLTFFVETMKLFVQLSMVVCLALIAGYSSILASSVTAAEFRATSTDIESTNNNYYYTSSSQKPSQPDINDSIVPSINTTFYSYNFALFPSDEPTLSPSLSPIFSLYYYPTINDTNNINKTFYYFPVQEPSQVPIKLPLTPIIDHPTMNSTEYYYFNFTTPSLIPLRLPSVYSSPQPLRLPSVY